jgi:hypothetical protein
MSAKVMDLTKRMLKLSTASRMTISEVAQAHYNCLASLALEAAGGDKAEAEKLIRKSMDELAQWLWNPANEVRCVIEGGKVVGR